MFHRTVMAFSAVTVMISLFSYPCYSEAVEKTAIELAPGMPAVELQHVPPLHVNDMEDAIMTGDTLHIVPPEPYSWVVEPGEPLELALAGNNAEAGDRAILTVWDWHNRPVAKENFDIPFARDITFESDHRGVYLLTLDRFRGDECISRLIKGFAMVVDNSEKREVWNEGEFFIGTAVYPSRLHWSNDLGPAYLPEPGIEGTAIMEADLNARLGIQVARLGADCKEKGIAEDEGIELYRDKGFLLHLKVSARGEVAEAYSDRAGIPGIDHRLPRKQAAARTEFEQVASRWAGEAFFVQFHNEPDTEAFWLGTAQEYIDLYKIFHEVFKSIAPQLPVSAGGYTGIDQDLLETYVHELKSKMDWATFHTHGSLPSSIESYEKIASYHDQAHYGDLPWANTEMGSRAWRPDRDRVQAVDAMQKTLYFWARGHRGVTVYRSRDIERGPGRLEGGCWGYLHHFMCPRFKYGTLSAMIDIYAGAEMCEILIDTDELQVYRFLKGDKQLIAAYQPRIDTLSDDIPMTLIPDSPGGRKYDAMGNSSELEGNEVKAGIGHYPVTFEWDAGARIELQF